MRTCSPLSSSGICRSFTKPEGRKGTKVRLVGGRSVRLHTYCPAVTFVSSMSSVSFPDSLVTADCKVSAKKRNGARRKRTGNKDSSAKDVNANTLLPTCQASNGECMQTSVLSTSNASLSLPILQSSIDNAAVVLENLPISSLNFSTEQPGIAAETLPTTVKQTGRRKARLSAVKTTGRTPKTKGCRVVTGPSKTTVVKRRRRCTGTTVNDKFIKSMTMFVSEVAKSMVSACVEQTFTQLSHQGLFFAPYPTSLSVDNGSVSLLNQYSDASFISSADQTYRFQQPQVGTLVSANHLFSGLPCYDFSLGDPQQLTSARDDCITLQSHVSSDSFSQSSDLLGTHAEHPVANDTATGGRNVPVCREYGTFSTSSNAADTVSHAEPVQLSNLTDYALIDLLNMSDDALDVLLSGSVDCVTDNPLPHSAANSNDVLVTVDARTYRTEIPVCCSVVPSVTEAFDRCPLLLAAVESTNMDFPTELYNESFDSIGEESFQPDYYESDEESETASVVTSSVNAVSSTECTIAKKISIKKPGTEKLTISTETRRKRPWKSSSRNSAASDVSDASVAVVVSSSETGTGTEPVVTPTPPPACEQASSITEEFLEGVG